MPARKPLPNMSAAAVEPLRQVGDYLLLEKLGEGGMGQVYRARHTEMDRIVAVKVLPPKLLGDKDAVQRFKKEVRVAARLNHPHIVYANDSRVIDGTRILVMEYLAGMDLADVVRWLGPLPIADACELVRQAALGLQCAHEHELVHRDVKPSNLMLATSGESRAENGGPDVNRRSAASAPSSATIKLLDLGLARLNEASAATESRTASGMVVGTPDYIAPEQISQSDDLDSRADVYSLGCTFYVLLTGQPPFSGPEHSTLYDKLNAHKEKPPPDIRKLRPEIPPKLGQVISRMVAKTPSERFTTPFEVAAALERFTKGNNLARLLARAQRLRAAGGSVPGRPDAAARNDDTGGAADPTRQTKLSPERARHRTLRWGLVTLVVAALAAVVTWFVVARLGSDNGKTDDGVADLATDVPGAVDGHEGTAGEGLRRRSSSDGNGRVTPSSDWIVLSWASSDNELPALWLLSPDGRDWRRVTREPGMVHSEPVFSPDGRRLAFTRGDQHRRQSGIWVCNIDGGDLREVVAPQGTTERWMSPAWLDDQRLICTRDPEMNLLNDIEVWQADIAGWHEGENDAVDTRQLFAFRDEFGDRGGLITDTNPLGDELVGLSQPAGQWDEADVFVSDRSGKLRSTVWDDDENPRRDSRALWSRDGKWIAWQRQFTEFGRDVQLRDLRIGVGLARIDHDGVRNSELQPEETILTLPVAWEPNGPGLLCVRLDLDLRGNPRLEADFVLMTTDFEVRTLFRLPGGLTLVRQRHGGRLGDWAVAPGDVALPTPTQRPL